MDSISINEFLNEFNTPIVGDRVRDFSLKWIRSSDSKNGKKGTAKELKYCQKHGVKASKTASSNTPSKSTREKGVIYVKNLQTEKTVTVKISSIIAYNGIRIRH